MNSSFLNGFKINLFTIGQGMFGRYFLLMDKIWCNLFCFWNVISKSILPHMYKVWNLEECQVYNVLYIIHKDLILMNEPWHLFLSMSFYDILLCDIILSASRYISSKLSVIEFFTVYSSGPLSAEYIVRFVEEVMYPLTFLYSEDMILNFVSKQDVSKSYNKDLPDQFSLFSSLEPLTHTSYNLFSFLNICTIILANILFQSLMSIFAFKLFFYFLEFPDWIFWLQFFTSASRIYTVLLRSNEIVGEK